MVSFRFFGAASQILLAGSLLAACGPSHTSPAEAVAKAERQPLYFDVQGLLKSQVQQLTARRAAVTKQVSVRGAAPETATVPAVKWAEELQLFFQADINKAALRGAYAVDSAAYPPHGEQRRYTRRPGHDNAPVESLLVLSEGGQPTEIQASITQKNALFSTHKQLRLKLLNGQLTEYGVNGTQKLVLFDTLRYATRATVR
ncbi:hypothetical protein [uncultured Hymenobacter sp.]|uniref:hypothetical protein n=1 Tax=uncultured Hymenobacter sp. TaxID=170016 RepID=UPI0035CADF06